MGLLKAGLSATGNVLADQWKEFFYCDAMEKDVLVQRGQKRTKANSSNKGDDNIITNGSLIAIADGQCMLIVDQGQVVEVCAQPGEFVYDLSSEPSIFTGNLGEGIAETFKAIGKRFTFGGDTPKDQKIYYVNTKELGEILFGTATPIPFKVVVNEQLGYSLSVDIRCNGMFTYKIVDPLLFYTNVCGNITNRYTADEIADRLKSELMNALSPALAKLAADRIQYYELSAHTMEISKALNEVLSSTWKEKRGIEVFSFNINSLSIPDDQRKKLTEWEETAMTNDARTAAARTVGGQIDAMKIAAGNTGGAMMGFMGMGMAGNGINNNVESLYAANDQAPVNQQVSGDTWTCSCGTKNTGNFCTNCGNKKVTGNFCGKCGFEIKDPACKFCPNCGNPIKG